MKTSVFALALASTWLLLARSTVAEPQAQEADSAKAAVRFQQGVELYREGSYEGALAEFRKAYQISPSYRVLYNIAQTQYALHDFVGAHKSLVQYLAEGIGEISAERRAQVDEMAAKLAERIAHLQIMTNLAGAEIRVDEVSVGTAPLSGPVPVNVGTRKVSAHKAGAPTAVRVLTVAGKETVKVELHLEEPMVTSVALGPRSGSSSVPLSAGPTPASVLSKAQGGHRPDRTGLLVSLSTTAVLAAATGVAAYLALAAQKDLKDQVNAFPTTRDRIEDARSKSKSYGYLTDALGAATLVSGGVALYFALSHPTDSPKPPSPRSHSLGLAPTGRGVVLQGRF